MRKSLKSLGRKSGGGCGSMGVKSLKSLAEVWRKLGSLPTGERVPLSLSVVEAEH